MFKNSDKENELGKIIIDLNSIEKNYKLIKKKIGKECSIAAVLKANAYGLGIKEISIKLKELGCKFFFVATLKEGMELRKILKDIEIFILNGPIFFDVKIYNYFLDYNLIPIFNSLKELKLWIRLESKNKKKIKIGLHFDTGMNRFGIPNVEIDDVKKLFEKKTLNLFCIMSHLSSADEKNKKINLLQKNLFTKINSDYKNVLLSIANSSAIFNLKGFNFSFVRSGGALFGINPTKNKNPMNNVISLHAKVLQIKNLKTENNKVVGYNSTYQVNGELKIAVLGIGYADGYPRNLSNIGYASFKNSKLPIVGTISMDYITVDLSKLRKKIRVGDWVELIGKNISIQDVAFLSQTIEYEILNNLGNRLQKYYIGKNESI